MNLLPKSHEKFSDQEYWESFFKKRGRKAFEWYGEYPELCGLLHKYIKPKDTILMTGCGNSTLSADLYDVGFRQITNIDISHVVIQQMLKTHGKDRTDLVYKQMDALNMTFSDNEFSVVLDKGTLDALMTDNSEEVQKRIDKFFGEIDRVLRVAGRYICVSLLQEHILVKLLEFFPTAGWIFRVCRCIEAENKSVDGNRSSFPVFVVICTKLKKLNNVNPVLEVCFTCDQIQRVKTLEDVVVAVKSVQQSAMVCARLSQGSVAGHGEVSLDLYRPNDISPRYTVYILDQPYSRETSRRFAAFIVPQGRETEWLFATPDGRITLLKSAGYDRLAVVALHRDHEYESLEAVQKELCDSILHLAPPGCRQANQIPYLSVGSDVGCREVCHRGHSKISGDFVIEEVEGEGGRLFRRLIFLNNQGTVQSEARLKLLKSRKGKPKKVIDIGYLASNYLIYMTVGVALAVPDNSEFQAVVIGLGGGGLCSFIQHCFAKIQITAVEIDPVMLDVATNYFGLVPDEHLTVYICDGIKFIQQAAENGKTFSVVLFDVDSKNHTLGMSCPPKEFLEHSVLDAVKTCIGNTGFFVLNLVCRNVDLKVQTMKKLTEAFKSVSSFKLSQEVNEVVFCSNFKIPTLAKWKSMIEKAAEKVNILAKKRKLQSDNLVNVSNLVNNLQIST